MSRSYRFASRANSVRRRNALRIALFSLAASCSLSTLLAQNYACQAFSLHSYAKTGDIIMQIDASGNVVGSAYDHDYPDENHRDTPGYNGFIQRPNGDVGYFSDPSSSVSTEVYGIDDRGTVLGITRRSDDSNGFPPYNYLLGLSSNTFRIITPAGAQPGEPVPLAGLTAINGNGDLAGVVSFGSTQAVILQDSSGNLLARLPLPLAGANPSLSAFNNDRKYIISAGNESAVADPDGYFQQLDFLGLRRSGSNYGFVQATGLNNKGVVAGAWTIPIDQYGDLGNFGFVQQLGSNHSPTVNCGQLNGKSTATDTVNVKSVNDKGQVTGEVRSDAFPEFGNPVGVVATPTGTAPAVQLSNSSWIFNATPIAQTKNNAVIYVTNRGNGTLHIPNLNTAAFVGPAKDDFAITDNNCSSGIGINHTCAINFSFTPSNGGNRQAYLVLADDSPAGPHKILVQGVGAGPQIEIAQKLLNFAGIHKGQKSGRIVVYPYNAGSKPVPLASIAITGADASAFAISGNTCGLSLAPYKTCAVGVIFAPDTVFGFRYAALTLDIIGSAPRSVPLMGYAYAN